MRVKPEKCRCLVIKRGRVSDQTLTIDGERITSLKEKSVKYLGKLYKVTLHDKEQVEDTISGAREDIKRLNKAKLPGRYKGWILQHMLLPRIMWPLTIYEFPATKVEEIQRLFTSSLKRWLGLPKFMSTDIFYSKTAKLQLPYTSLVEEVKAAKARMLTTFDQSPDACISRGDIDIEAGRKWSIRKEVEEAQSKLRLQEIAGIANVGREGLGIQHRQYYSKSTTKEKRSLIVNKVREKEEEIRRCRITGLSKQGASYSWNVPERKLSHNEMVSSADVSLRFLIRAVYDLLPTPSNKNTWFRTEEFKCKLCGGAGTLNHILAGCNVALKQGRYTYRHNNVLREIAQFVEKKKKEVNSSPWKARRRIAFRKAGETRVPKQPVEVPSYLDTARDWILKVDLDKHLKIPAHILETNLRPDMLLISERSKQLAVIELTVPTEERVEISAELKRNKYTDIEVTSERRGWKTKIWTIEVGCRGFPAATTSSFFKEIGFAGKERKMILRKLGEVAARSSHNIWKWSHHMKWGEGS